MAGTVHVLGAGLAGMVAAVRLARSGRDVRVLDGAKGLGGMGGLHPSVHTTPVDPGWLSDQVGIDLRPAFHPTRKLLIGINEKTYRLDPGPLHTVERGGRASSIDALLYDAAREAGVRFEFGVFLKDLRDLPPGSIVATGLHPEMYDYLEIPFEIPRGFAATRKGEGAPWCVGGLSAYTDDYFYANGANELVYALLFGRRKVTAESLAACERDIRDKFDLAFDRWEYFSVRVPTGSASSPTLFRDGYVLAGTVSGAMDPVALFGIHGAILSGRVAAMAVEDPESAAREFRRMNRYYRVGYYLKEAQRLSGRKIALYQFNVDHPRLSFPLLAASSLAVPGYRGGYWNYEIARGAQRIA